jgi:hypothetical protein
MRKNNCWREEEDKILIETISKLGVENWNMVAKSLLNRNGKQCRERWLNHLCPEITVSFFYK